MGRRIFVNQKYMVAYENCIEGHSMQSQCQNLKVIVHKGRKFT